VGKEFAQTRFQNTLWAKLMAWRWFPVADRSLPMAKVKFDEAK
jgi:hypothetical protein